MSVGAAGDPTATRGVFRTVARLADDLGLEERSMGMSDDLESAVEHGSTMVRIGPGPVRGPCRTGDMT